MTEDKFWEAVCPLCVYRQPSIKPLYLLSLSSDIDECATQMHYCQSNTACVNLPGGHRCDCLPGFIRVDEYSCTGTCASQHLTDFPHKLNTVKHDFLTHNGVTTSLLNHVRW